MESSPIVLEVWSDVQCPFCYIGKRQLEEALAEFPERDRVQLEWKSFQLDPTMQSGTGESIEAYLARRKGISVQQVRGMHDRVLQMAEAVGLHYDFEHQVVSNSAVAHRLIQYAKTVNQADALEEVLFRAHFTQGRDLGNNAVLLDLATEAGLDAAAAEAVIADAEGSWSRAVEADVQEAHDLGSQGVPFFVFNRQFAVSGAQGAATFLRALTKAAEPATGR